MNRLSRLASRASSSLVFSPRRRAGSRLARAVVETVEARRLLASVAGVVFNDANANGKRDAGEAGLVGEAVYADRNNNGLYDGTGAAADVATRVGADGAYVLANLPADGAAITIRLRGDLGARVVSPAGNGYAVKLTAATPDLTGKDFAVGPTAPQFGNPAGFVYADVDKSGTYTTGDLPGVGSTVFADLNGNGKLDAGEPAAKADDRGYYALTHVPATGKPLAFVALVDAKGTTGTATYAVPPSKGFTYGFDIKYAPPANLATIAGIVYADANGNGKVDGTDESGLADEIVYLDRNNNGQQDAGEAATRTTPNGHYTLANVALDGSTIAVRLRGINAPRKVTAPAGGAYVLTLNAASTKSGLNFSLAPAAPATPQTTTTVSGALFDDANGNGKRDAGEAGIEGYLGVATLYADLNRNGLRDAGEPSGQAADASTFTIANVPTNATFDVRFADGSPALNGLYQTAPNGYGGVPRTVTTGTTPIADANFGFQKAGTLDAFAFVDANGNGSRDATEPYASGEIWLDLDGDKRRDAGEPIVPAPNPAPDGPGDHFTFFGVPFGTFQVAYSSDAAIGALAEATTTVTLTPTDADRTAILALPPKGSSLTGRVTNDANANGIADSGEAGLNFEVVYLDRNNNGQQDAGETATRTDANGNYAFANVALDGSTTAVRLRGINAPRKVTAPAGGAYVLTLNAASTKSGLNFSVAPAGPAMSKTATVTGSIYDDANGNGQRDAGEAGLVARYGQFGVYADLNRDGMQQANEPVAYSAFLSSDYALSVPVGATFDVRFSGLSPAADGLYQTGPAGFNGPPLTLTTTSDALIANANFGFLSAGTIVADAFVDANGNGKVDLDGVTSVSDPRLDDGVFWLDLDGDHRRDANEPLVPALLSDNENPGPGRVSLGVPYGTYAVAYGRSTAPNALADGTTIVTTSPSLGGVYAKIAVAPIAPAVSGLAFRDDNGDGVREAYEPPLSAATIYADYNDDGKLDGDEPSTTVSHPYAGEGNDASYSLPVAAGRSFTLRLDAPDVASAKAYALKLTGAQQATASFAVAPLRATVRGRVYNDANGNGVFDAGDTPRASEVVFADFNFNGIYDGADLATRSDASGYYTLNNVVRGGAYVRLRGVANAQVSQPSDSNYTLYLPAEGVSGIDFGVRAKASK